MRVEYILPDGEIKEAFELADGQTLNQAACTLFPDTHGKFPAPVIAVVGSTPAVRELGDWDFPLSGDVRIQFREIVMGGGGGGGGSDVGRTIAMVAVTIAAIVTSALTYGAAAPAWAGVLAGLAGAAVMTVGTLLVNAIFPAQLPSAGASAGQLGARDNEAASPTYNINASGNQARLYQPEPCLFGRMKIVPDFVAQHWMKFIGNDQFGYFVYGLTSGECEVESMQFGDTVFWKDGHFLEDTGYVTDLKGQVVSQPDKTLVAGAAWSEPIAATIEGTEFRTIDLEITFPNGLASYRYQAAYSYRQWVERNSWDSDGYYSSGYYETVNVPARWIAQNHTAKLAVQLRRISADGTPEGDWVTQPETVWTTCSEQKLTKTVTLKPGFGTWQVRVRNSGVALDDGHARETMVLSKVSGTAASMTVQFIKPGESVTIFPDNIHTSSEVSGQELFADNEEDYSGVAGPYATNPAGTTATRLYFDFTFPQGLFYVTDSGGTSNVTVNWTIEIQRINDHSEALGDWEKLADLKLTKGTRTPQRLTYSYDVPLGRYRARCNRITKKSGTRTSDTLVWQALRAELPGKYIYPISCVAIAIKANNTLSQSAAREFSVIATRKLPLYDRETKTWSEPVTTRSFAAAVSHVCKSEWGGRLADTNIDLDALWVIDERLAAKGWHYDSYIDSAYLVWTLLAEMCQSQCVIPRLAGPVLTFVEDAGDRPPTFALTPRNIIRDSFQINYVTWTDETPDDVAMDYLDADAGFAQRDVTAALPESENREPASLTVLGITNREHAFRVATRHAAHNRWSRVKVECQTEMLGRIVNRGDICSVSHPRFKNTASGVVKSWDAATLTIAIERDATRDVPEGWDASGTGLYVAFSKPDGTIWGPCKMAVINENSLTLDSGDYSTLLLQGASSPFDWMAGEGAPCQPTPYVIYEGKEYQRLMIVESVTSTDMQHYTLKLANYDRRIYQYENLPVPEWEGRGQTAISDNLSAPQNLRGIIESPTRVRLVWAASPGATGYDVETAQSGDDWSKAEAVTDTEYLVTAKSGMLYVRVRATEDGKVSDWSLWQGDTSVPLPGAPILSATPYVGGESTISWPSVPGAASYVVALWNEVTEFYTIRTADTAFTITPEIQTGGPFRTLTVYVTAENVTGSSQSSAIELSDYAPAAVETADVSIARVGETYTLTLNSVTPDSPEDSTGYLLASGETEDFGVRQLTELRKAESLPYAWTGLAAGTHYFRIAVRDAFYENGRDPLSLNWSDVLVIEAVPDEPATDDDTPSEENGNG